MNLYYQGELRVIFKCCYRQMLLRSLDLQKLLQQCISADAVAASRISLSALEAHVSCQNSQELRRSTECPVHSGFTVRFCEHRRLNIILKCWMSGCLKRLHLVKDIYSPLCKLTGDINGSLWFFATGSITESFNVAAGAAEKNPLCSQHKDLDPAAGVPSQTHYLSIGLVVAPFRPFLTLLPMCSWLGLASKERNTIGFNLLPQNQRFLHSKWQTAFSLNK